MTEYKFVNPGDAYTFEAPDDAIADAVCALVSPMTGWSRDGAKGGMIGLPGRPADAVEASAKAIGCTVRDRPADVCAALRTLEIDAARRKRLDVDPDKWHDEMRTSANDFRAAALSIADQIEAGR